MNRTINIVFHGHSVPSGYFKTPQVNTLSSYPHIFLKKLKDMAALKELSLSGVTFSNSIFDIFESLIFALIAFKANIA
jgi:hypothetical protein